MNGNHGIPQEATERLLATTLDYFERNPANWTAGQSFLLSPEADNGISRCWLGALFHFAEEREDRSIIGQVEAASATLFPGVKRRSALTTITEYNDDQGREAVIAKLREALSDA